MSETELMILEAAAQAQVDLDLAYKYGDEEGGEDVREWETMEEVERLTH